jgi:hypothetical protein
MVKFNKIIFLGFIAFIGIVSHGMGQGSGLPLSSSNYPIIDRLEIKSGKHAKFQTSLKTYLRGDVAAFAIQNDTAYWLTKQDKADIRRVLLDNNEWVEPQQQTLAIGTKYRDVYQQIGQDSIGAIYRKVNKPYIEACMANERYERCKKPIWRYFYPTPANWLELNKPNFQLRVNPLVNFSVAKPNSGDLLFYNQRGLEIRGGVDDRLYFYSKITDTQARFADYVQQYIAEKQAIPGNGFYKNYESTVFNSKSAQDFINGQGHIGFHVSPSIRLEFGHGNNFIGNGYRSLLLSDFAHNYLYLKANWDFWRIHYQNLFTELTAVSAKGNPGENYIPRKYMAAHYLGFDVADNFTIGVYEATIFKRDTSNSNSFELQYLNPVILYRSVEHLLDSKDNILVGMDFKLDLFRRLRLYGQFVLDEFKLSELKARSGWWANKYGIQLGAQYIDVAGIDHLDIRTEFNAVRPYTYTHSDLIGANYSHYNQALAHPLGANFREFLSIVRYQPLKRLVVEARYIHALSGKDVDGQNWGSNILLDYDTHVQDYGNEIGQGSSATTNLFGFNLSYEIWHNLSIDLNYFNRKLDSVAPGSNNTNSFVGLGVRWNTGMVQMDF